MEDSGYFAYEKKKFVKEGVSEQEASRKLRTWSIRGSTVEHFDRQVVGMMDAEHISNAEAQDIITNMWLGGNTVNPDLEDGDEDDEGEQEANPMTPGM